MILKGNETNEDKQELFLNVLIGISNKLGDISQLLHKSDIEKDLRLEDLAQDIIENENLLKKQKQYERDINEIITNFFKSQDFTEKEQREIEDVIWSCCYIFGLCTCIKGIKYTMELKKGLEV